jgi:sialate O-acetylesterase
MKTKRRIGAVLLLLFISTLALSQVRLPRLVSDGMILQRDFPVRIWGWASSGEHVTVHFRGESWAATANQRGEWEVRLSNLKPGGPDSMRIDGSNSITIKDVAVGDVWVCSGQSNMQLALGWLGAVYQKQIDSSENPFIRQFLVPAGFNVSSCETDLKSGNWQKANPTNVRSFTAVGYFFAKALYEHYKVPIGLINASVGGSSTEAWISEESIRNFPKYHEDAQRFMVPGTLERITKADDERAIAWNRLVRETDAGYKDAAHIWSDPAVSTAGWETLYVPGYWPETNVGQVHGVFWFRREFTVPASMVNKGAMLKLGRIVDADSVFINGKFVGSTGFQYAPRFYRVPEGVLKDGENCIVVRVVNFARHGGFVPGKPYEISANGQTVSLEGEWKYRLGAAAETLEDRLYSFKIPTGHFNGMIAPLTPYAIKGVLWYQGESNTSRAYEHFDLFKTLIRDWRMHWGEGDFPFVYAQLPNFVEVNIETTPYDWALLRESQLKALAIPATGMAVSIDIGEWNDIHPVNKSDLGSRLALAARKVAYGEAHTVSSGPLYASMKIKGSSITLAFTSVGTGLVAKGGGPLKCFEICGVDGIYVPAEARIEHGVVVVSASAVKKPVAARYAWSNNPEDANLYNKEGLPASPFRTSDLY